MTKAKTTFITNGERNTTEDLYKEIDFIEIDGISVLYRKPGIYQMPYFTQWLLEGFAPTVFVMDETWHKLTLTEQFDQTVDYFVNLSSNQNLPEDEKQRIIGTALINTRASIEYLFPAIQQCFTLELSCLKNEHINTVISIFLNDFFEFINSQAGIS
jgi:hypothetical protein